MKILSSFSIIILFFLFNTNCLSQTTSNHFGTYYRIDTFAVLVPFPDQPNVSPKAENDSIKFVSYQYAFPSKKADINFLYGTDVIQIKHDEGSNPDKDKLAHVSEWFKRMYNAYSGILVSEKFIDYHGSTALKQKFKVRLPNVEEVYIQSILFLHEKLYIRMYTFTPLENEDNAKIDAFYETIVFDKKGNPPPPPPR